MKINFYKVQGGNLVPATDLDHEKMTKFKSGEMYEVEIKLPRNPKFHRKVFAFFHHCFQYWKSDREFMDEQGQFDVFRKHLIVLAGFYNQYFTMEGEIRIEAKSLAFGSMSQEQFELVYGALIQAAITHIFAGMDENQIYNELAGFF